MEEQSKYFRLASDECPNDRCSVKRHMFSKMNIFLVLAASLLWLFGLVIGIFVGSAMLVPSELSTIAICDECIPQGMKESRRKKL